jgi:hypothetical protein
VFRVKYFLRDRLGSFAMRIWASMLLATFVDPRPADQRLHMQKSMAVMAKTDQIIQVLVLKTMVLHRFVVTL